MLPAAARLRRSQDFGLVVRRGRRAGRPRLVMHVLRRDPSASKAGDPRVTRATDVSGPVDEGTHENDRFNSSPTLGDQKCPRVGFVVSKAVGNAVCRHRVARQLRHLMRERIAVLPAGTLVVVRALPPAAASTSEELARDLDKAMRKLRLPNPRDSTGGGDHLPTDPA